MQQRQDTESKSEFCDQDKFLRNLQTAMSHALITCVLGTDNRFHDFEKSGGWNSSLKHHNDTWDNYYLKFSALSFALSDCQANASLTENGKWTNKIKQWHYHIADVSKIGVVKAELCPSAGYELNPLWDDVFHLDENLKSFFYSAMLAIDTRYGYCGVRSDLIAKYLWEHPYGIHRIEKISMATFDHALIIVNRSGDLKNPDTWGDAWIIDGWYGESGIIFPAEAFKEKIKIIKQFAKDQITRIKLLGLTHSKYPEQENDIGSVEFEIVPTRDKYPSYSPHLRVEDYYTILNGYGKDWSSILYECKTKHKARFKTCLKQINLLDTKKRAAFFQNKKSTVRKISFFEEKSTRVARDHSELIALFLKEEINPHQLKSALLIEVVSRLNPVLLKLLLDAGAVSMINSVDNNTTALLEAAKQYDSKVLRILLDAKADPVLQQPDFEKLSVLHVAKTVDAVKILIERGASLRALNQKNETPLQYQAAKWIGAANPEIVNVLLKYEPESSDFFLHKNVEDSKHYKSCQSPQVKQVLKTRHAEFHALLSAKEKFDQIEFPDDAKIHQALR